MKTYDIGVDLADGGSVGFVVVAENADRAYDMVVEHCRARKLTLLPGHMFQARSDLNEWFDRMYSVQITLDGNATKR